MRRTVKVSFSPRPLRPMTMPVKIWIRSLSPSITRVCTRTLSPTLKFPGSAFCCSLSIASIMRFIFVKYCRGLISDLQKRLGEARLQPRADEHFQLGQGKLQIETRARSRCCFGLRTRWNVKALKGQRVKELKRKTSIASTLYPFITVSNSLRARRNRRRARRKSSRAPGDIAQPEQKDDRASAFAQ